MKDGRHMFKSVSDFFSVSRFHIVLIAAGGSLVFGRLLTGSFQPALALVVALDWFLVNILNRVIDRTEDAANRIRATDFAVRKRRFVYLLSLVLYAASFSLHFFWQPSLLLPRIVSHLLGMIYNFRLVPLSGGRRRLKELYAFKNTASCAGFLLTLFAYPLAALPLRAEIGPVYVLLLIAYFAPLQLSFEVIYDLRDVRGDRLANVASFPVVHGPEWSGRLVVMLNVASIYAILAGAAFGFFGLSENILVSAPILQIFLFMRGARRGFSQADCVAITWTFAAMNFIYCAWVLAGLPTSFPLSVGLPAVIEAGLLVIGIFCWFSLGKRYGKGRFLAAYGLIALGAWLTEQSAIGWYRFYRYAPSWDFFIGDVPFAVVLIWPMVILSTHHIVRRLGFDRGGAVLAGALMVTFEAILVEISCAHAGLWFWEGKGVFGVPVIGILGWGAFALGAMYALEFLDETRIVWLPVLGLATAHLFLQGLWRIGLRHISYTEIPPGLLIALMTILSIALTRAAVRNRKRISLRMTEIVPRILAAQLVFYILLASRPDPSLAVFACLFAPPYLTLLEFKWGTARRPGALRPVPANPAVPVHGWRT